MKRDGMNPIYFQAKFLSSAPDLSGAPADEGLEIAFAGRSNAGKSSAINTITRQKNLARTSKTPGRTQLLNFFSLSEQLRLVDLPGYGYAQVPADVKKKWQAMMERYLARRESLCGIVLVMDTRHPLTDFDWQMLEWSGHNGLPLHILLTKADKLPDGIAQQTLTGVQEALDSEGYGYTLQLFSALKKKGVEDAHLALDSLFAAAEADGDGR